MAKLTTKTRNAIPTKQFALPGRRYPIEDRAHAANAKSRVAQNGTPTQKAEVYRKVDAKYPDMGNGGSRASGGGGGKIPRGEHHHANHREPKTHAEFERLGNPGNPGDPDAY